MERIVLYPHAGTGGRNYFKQLGTTQDVILNDIKLEEGLRLSFYCEDICPQWMESKLPFSLLSTSSLDRLA
jgi:hypothetical protein